MKVLIVDADRAQRALLTHWMKSEGYRVEAFADGRSFIRFLESKSADLIILDWSLPDIAGDDLLRWVRGRRRASLPVIFQTPQGHEKDVARILDSGADDCLVRPVWKSTLLARVRAVIRRAQYWPERENVLEVGSVTLNRHTQTLATGAGSLTPSDREFAIAWQFAVRRGQVILRQQLLSVVWGLRPEIETRAVDMYVSRLRAKLRRLQADDWQIQAVYGVGYRLELAGEDRSELPCIGESTRPGSLP